MNIFKPYASSVEKVGFAVLSSDEIKALSVKRIQNTETFDTLQNPVPGGLYDPALGAWGDYWCTTCNLNPFTCPGHPGHVELPLPVFHCLLLDQTVALLSGKCSYCHFFRMSTTAVHAYMCKLQLLKYGLLEASRELDNISVNDMDGGESSEERDADEKSELLISAWDKYTRRAIKNAKRNYGNGVNAAVESVIAERRRLVKDFFAELRGGGSRCKRCSGRSPKWRKDRMNKIFRRPLGSKDAEKMRALGLKPEEPLLVALRAKKLARKEREADKEADEGIEMDGDSNHEDEEAEAEALLEKELVGTGLLDANAQETKLPESDSLSAKADQLVNVEEVYAHLVLLFEREHTILELIYGPNETQTGSTRITPDRFFIRTLLVPPNRFRPENRTSGAGLTEADQNNLYRTILNSCSQLRTLQETLLGKADENGAPPYRKRNYADFQNEWVHLQDSVNALFDSNLSTVRKKGASAPDEGVKQKLEKKEGLFRMNMMGKRVNFAARSVISPDPNIETNEIGVPPVFAKKLTFAEPVTNHNFAELKQAVINGYYEWPGAAAIESETGSVVSLMKKSKEERAALANQLLAPSSSKSTGAKNKKVHRHLNNGDIVIMNRQPTLHKPSMMCHRARILPGEKTIRMHYANCNTYNADFDGDEMNMHFPQSEIGRAEALTIADTDHQYLVPTSGKPLRGLIQDHISLGVALTNRDTLFSRAEYNQLIYNAIRPENGHTSTAKILLVDPAIIKPRLMWTGKQVISTILLNIKLEDRPGLTLTGKSQTEARYWGPNSEEQSVIFQDGHLICGILDKAHFGPANGGFVHAAYEAYGHTAAGKLLSSLGRLLTNYANTRAWSCGMEDIVLSKDGDKIRRSTLAEAPTIGTDVAAKYVSLPDCSGPRDSRLRDRLEEVLRDDAKQLGLDNATNSRTKDLSTAVTKNCLPGGLFKPFPRNHMQTMTASGAKGSIVNANQISCNLGQQVLEGRRVPVMVSGKTLPCFKPFETDIRAGGYITNRFLSGVRPQEYYFHAMAGREGLIDTAVKTSRSGYLQRCVVKGMEGLKVEYDSSVRDADGTIVQFLYGEDGLDVTRQKHLRDFKFLAENFISVFAQMDVQGGFERLFDESASDWNKKALKQVKKGKGDSIDPVLAQFNPGSKWGSTSEAFAGALRDYMERNPDKLIKDKKNPETQTGLSKKNFQTLMDMKYMKSVVDPGEAVGIIAGQSVGEPSTQMTLNTFHLAGHAAKNVTLGIPRLKEIVMTASHKIATPTMTLRLNDEITAKEGSQFAMGISRLTLAEIIDNATVEEKIGRSEDKSPVRTYEITLDFYPKEDYEETYQIRASDVARALEKSFVPGLWSAIKKDFRGKAAASMGAADASNPTIGIPTGHADGHVPGGPGSGRADREGLSSARVEDDSEGEEDPEENDTATKRKNRDAEAYDTSEDEAEAGAALRKEGRGDDDMDGNSTDEGYVGSNAADSDDENNGGDKDAEGNKSEGKRSHRDQINEAGGRDRSKAIEAKLRSNIGPLRRFEFNDVTGTRCKLTFEFSLLTDKLLMLNLVETACHGSLIQFIPGIKSCTYTTEEMQDPVTKTKISVPVVLTEGANLLAMREYQDVIDPRQLLTNDVGAMLNLYGVEAARTTVIREMDAVFAGHGIAVDLRHLTLIADMMTRDGGYRGFNRGDLGNNASPFMKMSFETTLAFLKDAVLAGDWDDLSNPSARIVTGKTSRVGTGAFDVLVPLDISGGIGGDVVKLAEPQDVEMED